MKKHLVFIIFIGICVNALFAQSEPFEFYGDFRVKSVNNWQREFDQYLKLETNIALDYQDNDAWMQSKLKIVQQDALSAQLDKLLIGYVFFHDANSTFSLSVGKDKLENLIATKLQGDSHYLGVVANFSNQNSMMDFDATLGISDANSHSIFGELSYANLMQTNLSLKYSLIHWHHSDYLVSQTLLKYQLDPQIALYGAYLVNHATNTLNHGYYTGFEFNTLLGAKKCVLDVYYKHLESLAVPVFDSMGFGNAIHLKATYAFTQALTLQCKFNTQKILELSLIYNW